MTARKSVRAVGTKRAGVTQMKVFAENQGFVPRKSETLWQGKDIMTVTSIQIKTQQQQQPKSCDITMNLSINRGIEPTRAKRDENYLNTWSGKHS